MPSLIASLVLIGLLVLLSWLSRSGARLIASRNARLAQLATSHGLTVTPSPDAMLFAASGVTPSGVPLRLSVDRIVGAQGRTRWQFRAVARPVVARPALVICNRARATALAVAAPSLHEVSSGDPAFDQIYASHAEEDAPARALLDQLRADLLTLGPIAISGMEMLKVGSEIALVFDSTLDTRFFEDGRLEKALDLTLRLASPDASHHRAQA
jgi:hypothetical protein